MNQLSADNTAHWYQYNKTMYINDMVRCKFNVINLYASFFKKCLLFTVVCL